MRLACVPEAGLLDVEYRYLHDSVADDPQNREARKTVLTQAGFYDPHGLRFSCVLSGVSYLVSAEQGPTSNFLCGGSPEIYLTVTRDGASLLSNVVFGTSCHRLPSVTRLTIGDGPHSWRGRETQVCYSSGKDEDPAHCDWTFGDKAEFDKRFPIDEERVRAIGTRVERRQGPSG